MVRLKDTDEIKQATPEPDFNSTMVRLKEMKIIHGLMAIGDFNSTMVRLKDGWKSIIQFFSWFQFHYGSIKGKWLATTSKKNFYFNSTMVRLKEQRGYERGQESDISIPLWFD